MSSLSNEEYVRLQDKLITSLDEANREVMNRGKYSWRYTYDKVYDILLKLRNDKNAVCLSSQAPRVSYEYESQQGKSRRLCKLSRYLTKEYEEYTKDIPPKDLEALCLEFESFFDSAEITIEKNVAKVFAKEIGGSSCMTGSGRTPYVQIYNDNGVEMVVYQSGTKKARALLWTSDCGQKIMDRIYPNSGMHVSSMIDWAKKNNVIYRTNNSAPDGYSSLLSDKSYHEITWRNNVDKFFPYMDTFRYWKLDKEDDKEIIILCNEDRYKCKFRLHSQHGEGPIATRCGECGEAARRPEHGAVLCTTCLSKPRCTECGKKTDKTTELGEKKLCNNCISLYPSCTSCQTRHYKDDMKKTKDGNICIACAHNHKQCSHCSVYDDNYREYESGNILCTNCDNFEECCGCDKITRREDFNRGKCLECHPYTLEEVKERMSTSWSVNVDGEKKPFLDWLFSANTEKTDTIEECPL